jgi:hypothetical protein
MFRDKPHHDRLPVWISGCPDLTKTPAVGHGEVTLTTHFFARRWPGSRFVEKVKPFFKAEPIIQISLLLAELSPGIAADP